MKLKDALTLVSIIAGIFAAVLWIWSTQVKVFVSEDTDSDGFTGASINENGVDLLKTAKAQNRINTWAAFMAVVAAIAQTAAYLTPETPAC